MKFNNPILRGFNPDPSICCDSERYFIVTSTFEYFPSCAVYESTDLSCWTFHSYALRDEKLLDLTGCENSRGTWAATIRFNRGRYYVITTNTVTGDNFIVWTDDIDSKAWNGPFIVRNGGIDPSLYFEDCYIEGTTDFIFGSATAWFERCTIHSKADSYITAASTPEDAAYGYVFSHCWLTADEGVTKVYLGRPWRPYAYTLFIYCEMGSHIRPEGWHNWRNPANETTARYMEYGNTGSGASGTGRVAWCRKLTGKEAKALSASGVLGMEL